MSYAGPSFGPITSAMLSSAPQAPVQQPVHQQPAVQNANGPVLNRKQRRKLEKRMRSEKFRRAVRHVKANRARELQAIHAEAHGHAEVQRALGEPLDIALEASMQPIPGTETAEREERGEYEHQTYPTEEQENG